MRIAGPFIMFTHVIGSLCEADVGRQSAATIKLSFNRSPHVAIGARLRREPAGSCELRNPLHHPKWQHMFLFCSKQVLEHAFHCSTSVHPRQTRLVRLAKHGRAVAGAASASCRC